MLRDLHLFNLLTQGSTITLQTRMFKSIYLVTYKVVQTYSTVLSGDSDLLCAFCLSGEQVSVSGFHNK
jgi:hypothetical protein